MSSRGLFLLLVGLLLIAPARAAGWVLEVEATSTRTGPLFLYFDTGQGFHDRQVAPAEIAAADEDQTLHFLLPDGVLYALRLDLMEGPADLVVTRIQLRHPAKGRPLDIPPAALRGLQEVSVESLDGRAVLRVPAGATDPFLLIDAPLLAHTLADAPRGPLEPARAFRWLTWGALTAAVVVGGVLLVRLRRSPAANGWIAAGGAVVVVGVRLWRYQDFVSWAPYLDQWTGEVRTLLLPFEYGALRWSDFLAPHHEHRIAVTRMVSLGLRVVNGEWDNRALVFAGYILQGATAMIMNLLALHTLDRKRALGVVLLGVLLAASLADWANQLVGFQIQFHALIAASVAALATLATGGTACRHFVVSIVAAVTAVVSMASGMLTPLVAAVASARHAIASPTTRREHRWLLLAALLLLCAAFGWWARPVFGAHDPLRPQGLAAVITTAKAYASWPLPASWASVILLWWPVGLLLGLTMRRSIRGPFPIFLLLMALWIGLQITALASARSVAPDGIASRYTGLLSWGVFLNGAALLVLWPLPLPRRHSQVGLAVAWTVLALGSGWWQSEAHAQPELLAFREETRLQEERLRVFMRSDDATVLTEAPRPELPYPHGAHLVTLLRDPLLQRALPAPLRREELRLRDPAAAARVQSGWVTAVARGAFTAAPGVMLAGAALMLIGVVARRSS